MISAEIALSVLLALAVILALVIPLMDSVEKFSKFISLRWTCVAIVLLIMVGVIIDFAHLTDTTRDIVIRGGLIIVGLFLFLRTGEKVLSKGWLKGFNLKGSVQKGDTTISGEINPVENKKEDEELKSE